MKAAMDATGVITLLPENSVEAFALAQWVELAAVEIPRTVDKRFWRQSMLIVSMDLAGGSQ